MGANNALQESSSTSRVPPGFRFHPTDEELVSYYLRKKVNMETFDLDVIRDVDLNKLEPWDLDERCRIDTAPQSEWYFFSHKDKKYPTGTRTNRATAAGFWKATGRDKAVHSSSHRAHIGMRKTLVFYCGRAPHGKKTNWIMHEYRLLSHDFQNYSSDHHYHHHTSSPVPPATQEDGWVVCRVFKKRMHHQKPTSQSNRSTTTTLSLEDQSSLITANTNFEDNNNNNFQVQNAFTTTINSNDQKLFCKLEKLDCEDAISKLPFLHMPELESLESNINNNISQQDVDYYTKKHLSNIGPSYYKEPEIFPSSLTLLDMPTLDIPTSTNYTRSLIFDSDDNIVENDQWGVLENLPRDTSSYHIPSSDLCTTLFSSNCDAEIWKPLL